MPKLKSTGTKTAKKPATKKQDVTNLMSREDCFRLAAEYDELSQQIKTLEERKKFLSAAIKDGCEKYGVTDDKGSQYMDNPEYVLGRVCKKSMTLDQETAVKVLESLGLGDVVDVVTVRTVNEDKLSAAVAAGRISINTVEGFTSTKTSFSVSVKRKESVTAEVEPSTLAAARRK